MKQTIYFVRHGESTANKAKICAGHTDVELTEVGLEQAESAGFELKESGIEIDLIISSPLKRAKVTAQNIASAIAYPEDSILISDFAMERFRGEYEGKPSSLQENATEEDYDRMGAESEEELIARAGKLKNFISQLPYKSILVVSHNQFGRAFVPVVRDEPYNSNADKLPNAHVFRVTK